MYCIHLQAVAMEASKVLLKEHSAALEGIFCQGRLEYVWVLCYFMNYPDKPLCRVRIFVLLLLLFPNQTH